MGYFGKPVYLQNTSELFVACQCFFHWSCARFCSSKEAKLVSTSVYFHSFHNNHHPSQWDKRIMNSTASAAFGISRVIIWSSPRFLRWSSPLAVIFSAFSISQNIEAKPNKDQWQSWQLSTRKWLTLLSAIRRVRLVRDERYRSAGCGRERAWPFFHPDFYPTSKRGLWDPFSGLDILCKPPVQPT